MLPKSRYLAMAVILLGVVSLVIGVVFIAQGISVRGQIAEGLRAEKVTLGIEEDLVEKGDVVDTEAEARGAEGTLEEHLRESYVTYGDTERDSPERTTYLAGTTLRNALNIAIMGYGVATVIIGAGVFMIITGLALGATGVVLLRLPRGTS